LIGVTIATKYLGSGVKVAPLDHLRQILGLPVVITTIFNALLRITMILGAITPFASRLYPHAHYVRVLSITCGTIAVAWPYVLFPLIGDPEEVRFLVHFLAIFSPVTLIYLTSTIFALGGIFYIETNKKLLEQWRGDFRESATYILIPYYVTLICNSMLIFEFLT